LTRGESEVSDEKFVIAGERHVSRQREAPKTGIENVAKADFATLRDTLGGTFEDTWTQNDG
jgi:sarcosine oxidase delta subunit